MYLWVDGDSATTAANTRREDQGAAYSALSTSGAIEVEIDSEFAFRAEASRMGSEWGFGAQGW